MGMSMHVAGIREPDEKHEQMLSVARSCRDAGLAMPEEAEAYFDNTAIEYITDTTGLELEVKHREYKGDMTDGFEVDVADIPVGVKTIRFYCSW